MIELSFRQMLLLYTIHDVYHGKRRKPVQHNEVISRFNQIVEENNLDRLRCAPITGNRTATEMIKYLRESGLMNPGKKIRNTNKHRYELSEEGIKVAEKLGKISLLEWPIYMTVDNRLHWRNQIEALPL